MKNKIRRRLYKKHHSVKCKNRRNKRKYYSQYLRNRKNGINNPSQLERKKNLISKKEVDISIVDVIVNSHDAGLIHDEDAVSGKKMHIANCVANKNDIEDVEIFESISTKESNAGFSMKSKNEVEMPDIQIIIGYDMIYDGFIPKTRSERLEIIKNIPKQIIIYNISSINYLQRDWGSFTYNISDELQWSNLTYWVGPEKCAIYKKQICQNIDKVYGEKAKPVIFNRQANLFILQEVIYYGADLDCNGFDESTVMEDIFRYYLSVNSIIGGAQVAGKTNKYTPLEHFTASNLYIDVLQFANNPIFILERYPELIEFLRSNHKLNSYFANYFNPYGYDPEQMLKYIAELGFNLARKEPKYLAPIIEIPTDDPERLKVLDSISNLHSDINLEHDYDLSRIQKSPLYKVSKERYIVLDFDFLIQKLYQFSINDYYFDYIKPNSSIKYSFYAAQIGLFFENYVSGLLKKNLTKEGVTVKTLDELKTKKIGSEIELADFYIREGNKIILGQVKASALNTEQNKGTVESLFSDEKNFFSDFGVNQSFETIQYLKKHPKEFDNQLKEDEVYFIYPVIVLNESITSSLAMCLAFNDKLNNLLKTDSFPNFRIKYVTLIHIQDLERIVLMIKDGSYNIWDILDRNMNNYIPKPLEITLNEMRGNQVPSLNVNDYKFMKFANYNKDVF